MSATPHSDLEIRILHEDDIVDVRQAVRGMAQAHGFDSFAITALTTVASELARNIWVYAGGGEVVVSLLRGPSRFGLQLEFVDQGPGIADVERVLRGGYSTGGSLGMGLAGSRRLVDEFEIVTAAGQGTRITVRKWKTVR
jgi:serine/threonine-protein kinase RsbT